MTMHNLWALLLVLLLLGLPACDSSSRSDGGDDDDSATSDDDDSATSDDDDSATSDDDDSTTSDDDDSATSDDDDSATSDDDDSASLAWVTGEVTRSLPCTDDCVGTIYLAVMSQNPVLNPDSVVSNAVLVDADLSSGGAAYTLSDIPPRDEAYFISAFFDDDGDTNPADPEPDSGDLTATQGFGVPTIVIDAPGEHVFTVDLNLGYPL